MVVYLNGTWLPAAEAAIPIDDRGFLYADGVFETARLFRGGYFRFAAHYRRLLAGAEALRIPPPDPGLLLDVAEELVRRNRLQDGTFRVTLTRGREDHPGTPTILATLRPMPADWREKAHRGWSLLTATVRHPPSSVIPPHVKSLGRLHGILARLEARDAGVDDALLLGSDGVVTEGPTWNVFWRSGDRLFTPSLEAGVLDGVTRAAVIEVARELGIDVEETLAPREHLQEADEIFATMSSAGCVPVRELDGRVIPQENWTASRAIGESYWQRVEREVVRPQGE